MSLQRFLVTGGAGFIGSALVHRLVQEGHSVRVLDSGWRGGWRRLETILDRLDAVEGDIRDPVVVRRAAEGVDCVVHMASVNGTRFFYEQPELVLDVGIRGMLNVVDACRANGVQNLVVASSSEVYQEAPYWPADEAVPLIVPDVTNPRYSYGGQKIATELIAMNYGGIERIVVFRPHNVYGPDMGMEHVVPELMRKAVEAASANPTGTITLPILGDGQQRRAFVYIDDFIDGLELLINKGAHRTLYHIGTMDEVPIVTLISHVMAALGREYVLEHKPAPPGETRRRLPAIGRLQALGYAPKIPLREGIARVLSWYLETRHRS